MPDGLDGVIEYHPRASPAHHLSHALTHSGLVAVDGAFLAGGLVVAKLAAVEASFGIAEQLGALSAQSIVLLAAPTIKLYHQGHRLLLLADATVRSHSLSIFRLQF